MGDSLPCKVIPPMNRWAGIVTSLWDESSIIPLSTYRPFKAGTPLAPPTFFALCVGS